MSETPPTIEHGDIAAVEPTSLAAIRDRVRATIPGAAASLDRRGFQLLQWPPIRPNAAGKPIELSLEHEARLKADEPKALEALLRHLDLSEGRELLAGHPIVGRLISRRVERAPGAQSVDRYWDVIGRGFAQSGASLRQRTKTSKFMTWSGGDAADTAAVFNLELPLVTLGRSGVVARLEFNWIDDLAATFAEFEAHRAGSPANRCNPLVFVSDVLPAPLDGDLQMVIEHTTFREKYSLRLPAADGGESERFQMNIDQMMVQSLVSGHFAHHCDVDIAAAVPVDEMVLAELNTLAAALVESFTLRPANAPKYWWDLHKFAVAHTQGTRPS